MRNDKRVRSSFPPRWKSFPLEVGNFDGTNERENAADFYRADDYCAAAVVTPTGTSRVANVKCFSCSGCE